MGNCHRAGNIFFLFPYLAATSLYGLVKLVDFMEEYERHLEFVTNKGSSMKRDKVEGDE